MNSAENYALEIKQGEFTKKECTILLGKPDGAGGVKPVHGSTVQRFCRDKPPKVERLFHAGQSIPYAFRIISDELIAKIINNRTYQFVLSDRQEYEIKNNGGVFTAEIIDEEQSINDPYQNTAQSSIEGERIVKESVSPEPKNEQKDTSNLQDEAKSALINVDGIRSQFVEKMDKLELQIGDLNRENGELSEAKKYLENDLENAKNKLEILSNTMDKTEEQIDLQKAKLQSEKNKNIISLILFVATFAIIGSFVFYKIKSMDVNLNNTKQDIEEKNKAVKMAQQVLKDERSEHKQTVSDLRASINSWRLNSESRSSDINRLNSQLKKEEEAVKNLEKELEILKSQLKPQNDILNIKTENQ